MESRFWACQYLFSPGMSVVSQKCEFIWKRGIWNPFSESLWADQYLPADCAASHDILQECLKGLNIGPDIGTVSAPCLLLTAAARAENNAQLLFYRRKIVFHFLQLFHRGHRRLWASSRATAAPKPACDWWMCVTGATAASSNVWECSRWSWVAWATGTSNGGSHGRGLWWAVGRAVPTSHEQDQWWR